MEGFYNIESNTKKTKKTKNKKLFTTAWIYYCTNKPRLKKIRIKLNKSDKSVYSIRNLSN